MAKKTSKLEAIKKNVKNVESGDKKAQERDKKASS